MTPDATADCCDDESSCGGECLTAERGGRSGWDLVSIVGTAHAACYVNLYAGMRRAVQGVCGANLVSVWLCTTGCWLTITMSSVGGSRRLALLGLAAAAVRAVSRVGELAWNGSAVRLTEALSASDEYIIDGYQC